MAKQSNKQWIIRTPAGKVTGPYTKEVIQALIVRRVINGEEEISLHPNGQWLDLGAIPEFYDLLLEAQENEGPVASNEVPTGYPEKTATNPLDKMEANTVIVTRNPIPPKSAKDDDATKVASSTQIGDFTRTILSSFTNISKSLQTLAGVTPPTPKKSFDRSKFVPIDHSIPTMTTNGYEGFQKDRSIPVDRSHLVRFGIIIGVIIIGIVLVRNAFLSGSDSNEGRIHLVAPGVSESKLSPEESKELFLKVKANFERDNFSNWVEAQNISIRIAEAEPNNTEVREILCLAYKELWQYSYQDSEDLKVIYNLAQSTRVLNPTVRHWRTCELIRTWAAGKFPEAKGQLEQLIEDYPNISFYVWLKTDMMLSENDFINGQGFASSLLTIWPEFIRGHMLYAQANIGNGRFQDAREELVKVLQMNPIHKEAKLLLGQIEFANFQHDEQAWDLLITGVKSEEKVPRQVSAMAYTSLAILSEKKGDFRGARNFAEKGYELNPTNEALHAMVKKYGGNDAHFSEAARTQELVSMGDQYVRSGDCFAAQAQYRAAFDLNPKFPTAGLKAARCLHKINRPFEAFEILKQTIKQNPDFFPAYTLLADYYSQKFDFDGAMSVLNQARVYSKEAYELYKGYALVELRKNNFGGAIGYINRAIAIYSTDPDAFVILSKAQLGAGKVEEALKSAKRAIEIDPILVDAQIAYGQALGGLQGENAGLEYLRRLSNENKYVIEYKMAVAESLAELERYSEALAIYQEVVAVEPKNKKAQMGMAASLSGIGRADAALEAFLNAATFDPSDPEPLVKAGLLYMDTDVNAAIEQFKRVLTINKKFPRVNYYIGKASFLKGDFNGALAAAMEERRINPNSVDPYLLAAEVYMVTGKYSLCTEEYQRAIKIRPQGADNYVKLARCNRLSGSFDVAESMLDIAAEKESGYAEIYKERGALYQQQGEKAAAVIAYQKYLAISPNAIDKNEIEAVISSLNSNR